MLVAAAVCPHPPLLIPAAAGRPGPVPDPAAPPGLVPDPAVPPGLVPDPAAPPGPGRPDAGAVLGRLRAACRDAVAGLAQARPDVLVVTGGGARTARYPQDACGSLRRYGIPARTGHGEPVLPLSLTVGAWLVRGLPAAAAPGRVVFQEVSRELPPADCLRLGARLAALAPRVALLALGDGTARRATREPAAADPQAQAYDDAVAAALAAADPAALAGLDPGLDAPLMIAGRPAWQVLAGAAGAAAAPEGALAFAGAPFGVGYLVASWHLRPAPEAVAEPGR